MKNHQLGNIYLASTESELKNGWLKCGITRRAPSIRISEGNVASLRQRYSLLFTKETQYYVELEKHMHDKFENQKEWIKATLPEAVAEINRFLASKKHSTSSVKRFSPKKHQKDAVLAVLNEAKISDKASIVMPTGSGKTLTSLWISEALNAKTVLFLAPSLQLIRQTKDAWIEQANHDFIWMACCSADDLEDIESAIEMGGGMVSTNPSDIDGFIRYTSGKRVIFSTYQSLPSILVCDIEFDIIISDEAHRTAGISRDGLGLFNLVHSEKLKTKLRLYQTASPKVFKEDLLDIIDGDEDIYAFDMNNEKLYGKIVYEMTLGEAIEKKLLCDYRIIAIGVEDEELESQLKNRIYLDNGLSADEAAASVAIEEVFTKIDISHMISFHSRLALAEMTSKELNSNGLFSETIKGTMSTKKRVEAFERFKRKSKGVLTNAFALQEGIDIKKVDSIFFSSPKSSTISIVQAIGRALRLDPERPNKIAAIIVPVYASGDPNDKIYDSSFKGLYQLVSSISAVDYRLRAFVEGFSDGRGDKGESKPIDYIKLADFERLGFVNFTERLRDAFVFGTLSKRRKTFEENLNLYKDFI